MSRRVRIAVAAAAGVVGGSVILWLQAVHDGSDEVAGMWAGGALWFLRMAGLVILARWWWQSRPRRTRGEA